MGGIQAYDHSQVRKGVISCCWGRCTSQSRRGLCGNCWRAAAVHGKVQVPASQFPPRRELESSRRSRQGTGFVSSRARSRQLESSRRSRQGTGAHPNQVVARTLESSRRSRQGTGWCLQRAYRRPAGEQPPFTAQNQRGRFPPQRSVTRVSELLYNSKPATSDRQSPGEGRPFTAGYRLSRPRSPPPTPGEGRPFTARYRFRHSRTRPL